MNYYKHALSLTSQIYFCAVPVRLDSYNKCGYACGYCFSRTRQGYGRNQVLKFARPSTLDRKLSDSINGLSNSALDDFLAHRIPIQFGGMTDPFSTHEMKCGASLKLMRVLAKHKYPYLISTKGTLISKGEYLELARISNVYVRFSIAAIRKDARKDVDRKCPPLKDIFLSAKKMSDKGVPVCIRLQPIFPGHEDEALRIIAKGKECGIKHISAEYLKAPLDANRNFSSPIQSLLRPAPIKKYIEFGATLQGREYILPLAYRLPHLARLRDFAHSLGLTFGFADNDLLLFSDGFSCCNASDIYLKGANYFEANLVGIAKRKLPGGLLKYSDFADKWHPLHHISPYLNSKSRLENNVNKKEADWPSYIRKIWNAEHGLYSPNFFFGIEKLPERDAEGNIQYKRTKTILD